MLAKIHAIARVSLLNNTSFVSRLDFPGACAEAHRHEGAHVYALCAIDI